MSQSVSQWVSDKHNQWSDSGPIDRIRNINRKQLYVSLCTKWGIYCNICPLQSLFTPAQPRVIISEKVGAEIGLFPVSVGHQVWPKNPFLADGRIVLSAQGLGQQAWTLVLLLLYWGVKVYQLHMTHSQMLGKFEYTLPAKFWRLVGCTEMLSW